MTLENQELKDSALWWIPQMQRSGSLIYWLIIMIFLIGFGSLFFIYVDVSVRAAGIIRPVNERTDVRSMAAGIIDTVYYKEGGQVQKNDLLLRLRDAALSGKQQINETRIRQCRGFIHDLQMLTAAGTEGSRADVQTDLYRQEALRYYSRKDEQQIILAKADHETTINNKLAKDKVISPKEFYDIKIQQQKAVSAFESFHREQFTQWQTSLIDYKNDLQQCYLRQQEYSQLYDVERIRSPVTGFLQQTSKLYAGSTIQAGEIICSVSPGGELWAECYLSSRDIGLIRSGQPVRFQIDGLNYNYFGMATGRILSIDNDFILIDKNPVFKVRCSLSEQNLMMSNGYQAEIKKGMSFQARFILSNRSLWQLLYDGMENWLNPVHRSI